jgi:hypothetical protein
MNEQERVYNMEEFAAGASLTNPGDTMSAKVGSAAPEFDATTVDGELVRLSDSRQAACCTDDRRDDESDVRL